MCYKKTYLVLFAIFVVINFVKGSCLEYGHSCWGAHGKRSGTPTAKKIPNGNTLYHYEDRTIAAANDEPYFENFDDLTVRVDGDSEATPASSEDYDARKYVPPKQHDINHQRHSRTYGGSWRKFPLQNMHKHLIKSLLKQDFLQQLERKAIASKDNAFYDIN